jgi:hypothetical protein
MFISIASTSVVCTCAHEIHINLSGAHDVPLMPPPH